jgi:hypothetical protein
MFLASFDKTATDLINGGKADEDLDRGRFSELGDFFVFLRAEGAVL